MKVINTEGLIEANHRSIEAGQNRTLSPALLTKLDPNGTHVLGFSMPHANVKGVGGIRSSVLVKLQGKTEPHTVWLDFMPQDYADLVEAEEYEKTLKMLDNG